MDELEAKLQVIKDRLDTHRQGITNVRRVVLDYKGKTLEGTATCMAIPMLYAHWEGYVKEVCELYLEYIEASVQRVRDLRAAAIGHLWSPSFKPFSGGVNFERKQAIVELALTGMEEPVTFGAAEKAVETKSNLNFSVLEDIARCLCLDITKLTSCKKHLDALVTLRNNIAHGSSPTRMGEEQFEEHANSVLRLMAGFEGAVVRALEARSFANCSY